LISYSFAVPRASSKAKGPRSVYIKNKKHKTPSIFEYFHPSLRCFRSSIAALMSYTSGLKNTEKLDNYCNYVPQGIFMGENFNRTIDKFEEIVLTSTTH
jgi:hypothetical protein